ncbi:MAG: Hpt domain-containing protein [Chloroflexi bacterium]|nr:Hpt domain-containing protein [Chloroflexota bacterium]
MADGEPVSRAAFAALVHDVGDDRAFVAELVDSYVLATPRLVAGMREAVRRGESAALVRYAHELKSTSASLGADRLSALCEDVEVRARHELLDRDEERVAEIEAEADRVQVALRDLTEQP